MKPWEWDYTYEDEMVGFYYPEDIAAMEQIYNLISGSKDNNQEEQGA